MTSRQAKSHLLTLSGMAEKAAITHRFLKRKMEEYDALKAEIEALKSECAIKETASIQEGER